MVRLWNYEYVTFYHKLRGPFGEERHRDFQEKQFSARSMPVVARLNPGHETLNPKP
jgi:hypothetical protein